MQKTKKMKGLTPTQTIVVSILLIALFGGMLLTIPAVNNTPLRLKDGLFVATSAVSCAGLTTIVPAEQFNFWGQLILLMIIQIGGLGFMTFVTIFLIALKRKITLKERILIGTSYGIDSLSGLIKLTKRILKYTIIFETVGALFLSIRTISVFGVTQGIWQAVFLSISAFCNAGFDIVGSDSLSIFANDVLVNFTLMALILLGGIGFFVWNEIRDKIEYKIKNKISFRKMISSLSVNTKIIFMMTMILIIAGTLGFLILEYNNVNTIGNMSFENKLLVSLFHSVSARSAGFSSVNLANTGDATKILLIVLMFIGGASGSTAGGIKLITACVIFSTMISVILGKRRLNLFRREISNYAIKESFSIALLAVIILTTSVVVMSTINPEIPALDFFFETVSGFATCGYGIGITTMYSGFSKAIVMVLMYLGRVSTITMAMAIVEDKTRRPEIARYPQEKIMIG